MEKNENPIKNGKKSNFGILFRRWIDVIFYLFFTFLAYYSYKALETLSDSFLKNDDKSIFMYIRGFMSNGTNRWIYLITALLSLIIYYIENRNCKWNKFLNLLINSVTFPTSFIIILTGLVGIFINKFYSDDLIFVIIYISSATFLLFGIPSFSILLRKKESENHTKKELTPVPIKTIDQISDEEFIKWIKSDNHEDNDYFETEKNYKNQIKTSIKNNGNILLFGDYGIGKSWLLIKIEKELSEEKNSPNIFCFIDSWGRDVKSLPEQILSKMLYEISSVVDITHLQCIPSSYQEALSKSSNIIESILKIGVSDYNPEKVVERLDETLRIINKKVVVVIEDIDRNPNPKESLLKIEPLLDRFKNSENIQFILTISKAEEVDQEINKTINNKITLVINEKYRLPIFKKFRDLLLKNYNSECIDSYRKEERESQETEYQFKLDFLDNSPIELKNDAKKVEVTETERNKYNERYAYRYASELLATPRKMKKLFNEILRTWELLKGEVELDDLVFLLAIKNVSFSTYNFFFNQSFIHLIELKDTNRLIEEKMDFPNNIDVRQKENIKALSWVVLERIRRRKPRQRFFNFSKNHEKLLTLKTDGYDQKTLRTGIEYFENNGGNYLEILNLIINGHLYNLIDRFIYLDGYKKEGEEYKKIPTENMYNKIKNLLFLLIDSNYKDVAEEIRQDSFMEKIFRIAIVGNSCDEIILQPVFEKLFEISFEEKGLHKSNKIFKNITQNTNVKSIQYLEYIGNKYSENKNLIEDLINMNNPADLFDIIFDIPNNEKNRSPVTLPNISLKNAIIKKEYISFLLNGTLNIAINGKKETKSKGLELLLAFIITNLSVKQGKLDLFNGNETPKTRIYKIIEHLYEERIDDVKDVIFRKENLEIVKKVIEKTRTLDKDNSFNKYWDEVLKIFLQETESS